MVSPRSVRDLDAARACGALDHAHCRLDRVAVEVLLLDRVALSHLRARHRSHHLAARRLRRGRELRSLLEQHRRGRRLVGEREGAVLEDRDDHRNDHPLVLAGLVVELLDELPDVDAVLTERRTDRRRGSRLPGRALQFDDRGDFLGHVCLSGSSGRRAARLPDALPLQGRCRAAAATRRKGRRIRAESCLQINSTSQYPSDIGVARPKMFTETSRVPLSACTSSTVASMFSKAPVLILTRSPFLKETATFGCSLLASMCASTFSTSSARAGVGCACAPTKSPKPGVSRSTNHTESSSSICTIR